MACIPTRSSSSPQLRLTTIYTKTTATVRSRMSPTRPAWRQISSVRLRARWHASLPAQAAARNSASQPSIQKQRRRYVHGCHRPGRRGGKYLRYGCDLDGMHPYPLKQQPATPPHNHLYKNNGDGTFTDVTDQAGVAANIFGTAAI